MEKVHKCTKMKEVRDSEVFALKEKGWSYRKISNYYAEKGIEITPSAIQQRCKRLYKFFEKSMPKTTKKINEKEFIDIKPEEIYELKQRRYTFNRIKDYYAEKGINVSTYKLERMCNDYCKQHGLNRPQNGLPDSARTYNLEEIFKLRQKRMSYQSIADYVSKKYGEDISYVTVRRICKELYEKKEMKEPKVNRRVPRSNISDEEIIALRRQGYSFMEMKAYFESIGKPICRNRLFARGRKIFAKSEKGFLTSVDIRTADETVLKNALMNLKESKGATDKQIEQIANYYGIDFKTNNNKTLPYTIYDLNEKEL